MKRYEVSGFGVMEYEEVASTNSLAEKLPLSGGRVPRERIFQ